MASSLFYLFLIDLPPVYSHALQLFFTFLILSLSVSLSVCLSVYLSFHLQCNLQKLLAISTANWLSILNAILTYCTEILLRGAKEKKENLFYITSVLVWFLISKILDSSTAHRKWWTRWSCISVRSCHAISLCILEYLMLDDNDIHNNYLIFDTPLL